MPQEEKQPLHELVIAHVDNVMAKVVELEHTVNGIVNNHDNTRDQLKTRLDDFEKKLHGALEDIKTLKVIQTKPA